MPMKTAISKIFEQIVYYSTSGPEFDLMPKYNNKTKELAFSLEKNNFKAIRRNQIIYKGKQNKYKLFLNDERYHNRCSCECAYFIKHAVCMHLVGYSNLYNLNLFDIRYSKPIKPTNFVHKTKKGRKPGRPKLPGKALIKDD